MAAFSALDGYQEEVQVFVSPLGDLSAEVDVEARLRQRLL